MPKPCPLSADELEAVAKEHGTPFQLYDEAGIEDQARGLIKAFAGSFPGFKQFYAVKALPNPAILRLLTRAGCGLDCSSASELFVADKLGVAPEDVMYTSNFTSKADLLTAARQGVVINLDDISLVEDLAGVCKGAGLPFPKLICFRFNPGLGRTDSETASNVLGGPDAKFGVPREDLLAAYSRAKALGATRFGLHMMTGSCVMSDDYWTETVSVLLQALAEVASGAGIAREDWAFINIGGGLGIPYRAGEPENDPSRLAKRLRGVMDAEAARLGLAGALPRLYMENGRYVTGPFGWLVARCHVVKRAFGQRYCGLDACMSNLMRPGMYGAYHHISVAGKPTPEDADDPAAEPLNVVGTLCENNDWFAKQRPLPASAGVGDLFVVHDSGAHSHSMGFQYNGKLRAPELLLRRRAGPGAPAVVQRVRERETIASLFAETSIPADMGAPLRLDTPAAAARAAARAGEAPTRKMFVWAALAAAGAAAAVATALAMTRARQTA